MSDTESDDISTLDPRVKRAKPQGFVRRHWLGLTLATVVLVPLAAMAIWVTTTLGVSYSDGVRTGYNQKLSKKGWICKTWEGELAISAFPGSAPQIFNYSVRSDSVARVIETLGGQMVTLEYQEHRGVPTKCFGESDYYVTGVRKAGG